jgi:hypothetical protein
LAVGGKELRPAQLACLEDAKQVGEGKAEAMAKETGAGSVVVHEFGHGVIRMVDKTRRVVWLRANTGNDKGLGERSGVVRHGSGGNGGKRTWQGRGKRSGQGGSR